MMKENIKRFLKEIRYTHILGALAIVLLLIFYRCPMKAIFGIPCPGCGYTRAVLAALRLDFMSAYEYYPLFLPVSMALVYLIFRKWVKAPPICEKLCGILLLAAILAVYIIRVFVLKIEI